jgi:hypothetical protein
MQVVHAGRFAMAALVGRARPPALPYSAATDAAAGPLDPQDVGLGIFAGQSAYDGGAVSVPTCGLSRWMHSVWSAGGPQGWLAAVRDDARSSRSQGPPKEVSRAAPVGRVAGRWGVEPIGACVPPRNFAVIPRPRRARDVTPVSSPPSPGTGRKPSPGLPK